jgi:hypothetical protein
LAHRLAGFALGDRGALFHPVRGIDITELQAHEVAAPQLAVDRHIEQREVAIVVGHLKPDANLPDMFRKQRTFLAYDAAFVPGRTLGPDCGEKFDGHDDISSCPTIHPAFGKSDF